MFDFFYYLLFLMISFIFEDLLLSWVSEVMFFVIFLMFFSEPSSLYSENKFFFILPFSIFYVSKFDYDYSSIIEGIFLIDMRPISDVYASPFVYMHIRHYLHYFSPPFNFNFLIILSYSFIFSRVKYTMNLHFISCFWMIFLNQEVWFW